jgi:hypothetical protein
MNSLLRWWIAFVAFMVVGIAIIYLVLWPILGAEVAAATAFSVGLGVVGLGWAYYAEATPALRNLLPPNP